MAIIAPPRPGTDASRAADEKRLNEALRAWRTRLWAQQILHWTANGAITGIILACLLLLISRFVPWADALSWAFGVAAAAVLCSLGAALWFRPSFARTARLVDARLALHDRLSTAWELRDDPAPLPGLQRRDALAQLGRHTPGAAIPLRPRPTHLVITGTAIIALVLLLLLPNPLDDLLRQQAAFQKHLASEIAAINHIRTVIAKQPDLSAEERALIDQILREVQAELARAQNETQAQQILAQAQAQLNRLRDAQAASKAQALATASSALQNSTNANLSAAGKALASGDLKGLDKALQQLAAQLKNMTQAQRGQLAQQLEQAANQTAASDPQLSAALRQLARAIADNNSQQIAGALKAFENAAARDIASQATSNSIDQASQTLQSVANALASATDTGNSQNPGQSQSPGHTQNPGQGQSPGQAQGNSGSSSQGNSGNKPGKNEQVFIPGQTGTGSSSPGGSGNDGTVEPGKSVPYAQVIAQYAQMAHDAIDNSNIPPDLKNLIQDYYNSLEGQH